MDYEALLRAHLAESVDARGDLAPPWEWCPAYERTSIGWRMGPGEMWLSMYELFIDGLDPSFEARLAYLKRHAAAPVSWADRVWDTLYGAEATEDQAGDDEALAVERRAKLAGLGLIASDAAFTTWLGQQADVRWPWSHFATPEKAARIATRDLWFWSRQVAALRAEPGWRAPEVPEAWSACAEPLATGLVGDVDVARGLMTLARMLAAGSVRAPWQLGLDVGDFAGSFEMDMAYVDAFLLWIMSAFDDRAHLQRYLDATAVPERWASWIDENVYVD